MVNIGNGGQPGTGALIVNGELVLSAGTIGPVAINVGGSSSGTITTAALTQSAGALNIASGLVSVTGLYTYSGGTLAFTGSGSSGTLRLGGGVSGAARIDFGALAARGTLEWASTTFGSLAGVTLDNFFGNGTQAGGDVLKVQYDAAGLLRATYDAGTRTLTVTDGGNAVFSVKLAHSGTAGERDYASGDFVVTDSGSSFSIASAYPCFLRGTRIATLRGEVAVEDLRIGDLVVTASGSAQPIKWIGTRAYIASLVHDHHRAALMPVRIAAGALGEGCPARDLFVSPEHMMCVDDVLVPAEKLLNGTTVTRCERIEVVQYFHVELPRHSVIYAEGAPAESFLDTGNRNMFSNVLDYLDLGYEPGAAPQSPCLPVVTGSEALAGLRARLAGRAERMGLATTEDADLHLLADGVVIRPDSQVGGVAHFAVPAGVRQVRIVSRSVVPAELDPASGDRRRLGVCLGGLSLHDGSFTLDLGHAYVGLEAGFHAAEEGHRWTDGDAALPPGILAAMPGGFILELKLVGGGLRYPAPARAEIIRFPARGRAPERLTA